MPHLTEPAERFHASFLAAMTEFQAEGRGDASDHSMIGSDLREFGSTWDRPEVFAGYVEQLRADALEETPRPDDWVPCTTLWWIDGTDYLGRIAIRHRLTPFLREFGGHIGYDVRPTARLRGHATAMLRAALPIARELGIESALITCDTDNVGSRKVIEHNGGVLERQNGGKLLFWAPTS